MKKQCCFLSLVVHRARTEKNRIQSLEIFFLKIKENRLDQISLPLVHTSSMASGDVLPRFFTVFLSHCSSESMVIPRSYYNLLPRPLPKTAILIGTGGRFWKVAMTSKQEQVYFEQGWGNFVADNQLKEGEFLTFVFDGHKSYEVSIYGRGDCKETRAVIQVEEISDDTEDDNVSLHSPSNVSLDSLSNDSHHSTSNVSLRSLSNDSLHGDAEIESDSEYSPENLPSASISVESVEVVNPTTSRQRSYKRKTIENPHLYLDDPNNVCFETCLKLRKFELLVHAQLVKDYGLIFSDNVDYIDGYGKLTAKTTKWADQRVCINKWQKICERNQFTENDSILCEILRNEDKVVYAIKIHIFRDAAAST